MQRTRELGVRIALGATAQSIIALVIRDSIVFVLVGGLIGMGGALAATRVIRNMLFQTTASYRSARRAARTDPMIPVTAICETP